MTYNLLSTIQNMDNSEFQILTVLCFFNYYKNDVNVFMETLKKLFQIIFLW